MPDITHHKECKNCGTELQGSYCHQCGQEFLEERYSLKSLTLSIFSNFFNLEHGFFHTTIALFKHPGKVLEDYLDRNDVNYYNPIRLALVWITISVLITLTFGVYDNMLDQAFHGTTEEEEAVMNFFDKMKRFMNIMPFIFIPFYALMSKAFFRKRKLNYAEHLIMITYATAMSTAIGVIPAIVYIIFPSLVPASQGVSLVVSTTIFAVFGIHFFGYRWYHAAWRALLIAMLTMVLIALTAVIAVFVYQAITGTGPFA